MPSVTKEVRELAPADAALIIEGIFGDVVTTILAGNGFSYTVPDRSAANHMYVEALDRIVLKDRVSQRAFANASTVRKAVITTRVMQLVHQLLRKNIHTSKRDLFYADPNLFTAQEESDAVLNDIACIVGCTRTSLAVVASDKVRAVVTAPGEWGVRNESGGSYWVPCCLPAASWYHESAGGRVGGGTERCDGGGRGCKLFVSGTDRPGSGSDMFFFASLHSGRLLFCGVLSSGYPPFLAAGCGHWTRELPGGRGLYRLHQDGRRWQGHSALH